MGKTKQNNTSNKAPHFRFKIIYISNIIMLSTTLATATTAFVVATTMIGSTTAMEEQPAISFSAPIGFTQYMDTCEGETLYSGRINKITMLDTGSFCVIDMIPVEDGSETTAYSRLDVVDCTSDKVYDHWYKCTDELCADCEMEYRSYTAWNPLCRPRKINV